MKDKIGGHVAYTKTKKRIQNFGQNTHRKVTRKNIIKKKLQGTRYKSTDRIKMARDRFI